MKSALLAFAILTLALATPAAPTVTLTADHRRAAEYRPTDVPFKPYVAQLYSPNGVAVLRDNVADHLHHHGLMFAVAVDGVDFWSETPKCGRQVGRKLETRADELVQQLDWTAPEGRVLLSEERTVKAHPGPVTLLTWRSRLQARDEVKLTGSHYFGLGMRFAAGMDKIGVFRNSANAPGDVVRGTERLATATWCACAANGVTVALFDHPDNLRHPARMFTMTAPFAYLSATLNLWKEPYVLQPGQPLDLCYGVAVWDGEPKTEQIERLYRSWLEQAAHSRDFRDKP